MLKEIMNCFPYIFFSVVYGFVTDLRFMRLFDIVENIPDSRYLVGLPDKLLWRKKSLEDVRWKWGKEYDYFGM